MPQFVEIPRQALIVPLARLGFSETDQCGQVVMVRRHDCNLSVQVKVYTSIPSGGAAVRKAGKDSIRVCTVFEDGWKSFGIGKFPFIARVGTVEGVVRRVLETVRLAWERGEAWHCEQALKRAVGQ